MGMIDFKTGTIRRAVYAKMRCPKCGGPCGGKPSYLCRKGCKDENGKIVFGEDVAHNPDGTRKGK